MLQQDYYNYSCRVSLKLQGKNIIIIIYNKCVGQHYVDYKLYTIT